MHSAPAAPPENNSEHLSVRSPAQRLAPPLGLSTRKPETGGVSTVDT